MKACIGLVIVLLFSGPLRASSDCELSTPLNGFIEKNQNVSCRALMESETCKAIPIKDKKNCQASEVSAPSALIEYAKGCAFGLFNSAKEILEFLSSVSLFVWENVSDGKARKQTISGANDFAHSLKLYLYTEYDRALETASFPKQLNAARSVAGDVLTYLIGSLRDQLVKSSVEFACLNESKQSEKLCKLVGDVIIPPSGLFAILKGTKVIKLASQSVSPKLSATLNQEKFLDDLKKTGNCDDDCAQSILKYLEGITKNPDSPTRKTLTTLVEKHALELPLKEMTSLLEKQGFKKIESCVKLKDNCIQLPDGRDAPMLLFVHESGVVVRVKPEPIPGQFREKPHSSMMIVKPEKDFAPNLSHISSEKEARKFSDEMLSWDKELVKVDPVSGSLLPKHPGHLKLPDGNDDPELLKVYADAIMERAHPDLHVP
jgi:hypothetical protein